LELIRTRYADFGPTLAAEKLREVHGITIGRETLRATAISGLLDPAAAPYPICPKTGAPPLACGPSAR
jgi:hypothetical protein